jgi:leishmanolysin-like peptidase
METWKHFGCESLEGAELEDQGEIGTRFTHWEKRVFENEAMTGTYTQSSVFSRVTFAFLEDTGYVFTF